MAAKKKPPADATLDDLIKAGLRYQPIQAPPASDAQEAEPPPSSMRRVADVGLSALKGAIAVPEAAVGLADLATGGRVGKFLENEGGAVGFRPKEAKAVLDEAYSPQQKAANQEVQQAEGIAGVGMAALRNPSVVGHAVVESLPLMLGGGTIARAIMKGAPRLGAVAAGAAGEGIMAAGSSAESIRQESADGLLTGTQASVAGASGALTGLLGLLGGKVAQRLGIADIDTMIAGKASPASSKSFVRQVLEGAFAEGVLEELPQSVQEQVAQNLALDRPLDEGVDQAAVLGTLAGAAMGGGGQVFSRGPGDQIRQDKIPAAGPMTRAVNAPIEEAAKAADAAPPVPPAAPPGAEAAQAGVTAMLDEERRRAASEARGEQLFNKTYPGVAAAPAAEPSMPVPAMRPDALDQLDRMRAADEAGLRVFEPTAPIAAAPEPGDIQRPNGEPFRNKRAATQAQKKAGDGFEVLPVAGGYVVRKKKEPEDGRPEDPTDAALAQGADAGGSGVEGGSLGAVGPVAADAAEPGAPDTGAAAPGGGPDAPVGDAGQPDAALSTGAEPEAALGGEPIDDEWTAFKPETGTKGIPRAEMPQIKAGDRSAMVQFLRARGVSYGEEEVDAASLKPTQAEFSPAKVRQAREFSDTNRAILVSSDGHVLDGHHQWIAAMGSGAPVRVIRLDAPIEDLIGAVREFPSAQAADGAPPVPEAQAAAPAPADGAAESALEKAARQELESQAARVAELDRQGRLTSQDKLDLAGVRVRVDNAADAARAIDKIVRGKAAGTELQREPEQAANEEPAPAEDYWKNPKLNSWEHSGRADFKDGKPRQLPSYFTDSKNQNAKAWFRGWDRAKEEAAPGPNAAAQETAPVGKAADGEAGGTRSADPAAAAPAAERTPDLRRSSSSANTPVAPPAPKPAGTPSAAARWDAFMPVERRDMLAKAGYTDADQARVLSGTPWTGLTDPVRKKLDAAHKQQVAEAAATAPAAAAPAPEPAQADEETPPHIKNIQGWWGVGGGTTPDGLTAPGRKQALAAIGINDKQRGVGRVDNLVKRHWTYLPDDVRSKIAQLRKDGWKPVEPGEPVAAPAPEPPAAPAPQASPNTIFTEDAAAKARERLRKKLGPGTLRSGIDPEMLQDGITLAGYHIERGARTFAAYAKAMLEDLGDSVKPYLKSWYMGVKYDPRAAGWEGMDSAAAVDAAGLDAPAAEPAPAPAPEPAPAPATAPATAQPEAPAPKSFRKRQMVTTAVFVEETGRFEQREVDADTALAALDEDIRELQALRACIGG